MRKIFKLTNIITLVLSLLLGITACGGKETVYNGDVIHYSSSDASLANFLNDFTRRNLRFDEESIAQESMTLGTGTGFAKNWETMGLVWHNSQGKILGENKIERIKSYLASITQDDYGMIYNSHNNFMPGYSVEGEGISQGWPFPTAKNSGSRALNFEFNYESEADNWSATSGGYFSVPQGGYMKFAYLSPSAGTSLRIINESFAKLTASGKGIESKHAPVIEIELCYTDGNGSIGSETDVADVSIIFKTENGGDEWFKAPRSIYATSAPELTYSFAQRMFFSMYLNPDWEGSTITALGLEITAKEGKVLKLTDGKMNYIRTGYDTRQSNSTYQFLLALENYVNYTNDNQFLAEMMPKARKAISFLNHALQGENGLLDISFLYGHNGVGSSVEDGILKRNLGDGIGNGYWDILTAPAINIEANTYYYQALGAMVNLEKRFSAAGLSCEEASVKNRVAGEEEVTYNYTAETLAALKNKVSENISKDIVSVKMPDGTYENQGGLWNPDTGRFANGIRADNGAIIDYGFVYWNEEAVAAGLGTQSQVTSIMQWISGERIVEGDTSTGEDIYFYEFAPRFSTKKNTIDYGFYFSSPGFSQQVQDGGAVICWTYYDLVSRIKAKGEDDALSRLKGIQKWYEDVQSAGGKGTNFYNDYYMYKEEGKGIYVLQQSGAQTGAIGLDTEFLESIMLTSAVPYGFFGMDGSSYNNISFTNNLPEKLSYFQIDKMLYGGYTYSVRMEKNAFIIKNVESGMPSDYSVTLCFDKPDGNYKVKINGKESSDYTVENGLIKVTVPFADCEVKIG